MNLGLIVNLFNSTFNNNSAIRGGGAIFNAAGLINTMTNNTLSGNSSVRNNSGGGIFNNSGATISVFISNIVAGNTAPIDPDIHNSGGISFASFNLIGDGTGSGITNGVFNNQVGTPLFPINPRLGPLQFNGGCRWTMALLPGSLAINAGFNPLMLKFDERGSFFFREVGGQTDIGAYELQDCDSEGKRSCNKGKIQY